MLLEGRKALVTGARRSIGRGIAQALAEAGCDVGINDVEHDADAETTLGLVRKAGREAAYFDADISSAEAVNRMFEAFLDRFGRIDVLVNNPYASENRPFLEITEANWDRTLDVCLKGYFLCSQAAARNMAERGEGGSIVSISSVHARGVWANDTCYGIAKAGILRLTESIAFELAPLGIRCNAILPGYMDTEHTFGQAPPQRGSAPDRLHGFIPTHRYGTPEDIGRAVVFLCGPHGANVNGVSLPVDGGLLLGGVP